MTEPTPPGAITSPKTTKLVLENPIPRPGGDLALITLRKPTAGELRGLNATALMQGDISAVITLLPRISDPYITDAEAAALEAEDIMEAAGVIVGFFISKAQRAMIAQMTGQKVEAPTTEPPLKH